MTSVSSLEADSRWWLAFVCGDCVLDVGLLCFICEGGIFNFVLVAGICPGAVCILLSVRFLDEVNVEKTESGGTRRHTGGEVKGKEANGEGSQQSSA